MSPAAARPGPFPATTIALVALLAPPSAAAQETPVPRATAFVGATVIDGTGAPPLPDGVVIVRGDRIACVGTAAACPATGADTVVDLAGRFVTPGLIDAHVHFSQTGWHDGRPDGIAAPDLYPYARTAAELEARPERWHRSYLCNGITGVFDVGGHPWTTDLPEAAEGDPRAVHVRAAGPLVTWVRNDALNVDEEVYTFLPMGSAAEVDASVARLDGMGADAVKVWYLTPPAARRGELDALMMRVGERAEAAGLDLIVHATSLREAKVALRAGARMLVHSVEDRPVDREFLDLLLAADAVYAPTLVVGRNWSRAVASVALGQPWEIEDPAGCVDPDTRVKVAAAAAMRDRLPPAQRTTRGAFQRLESAGAGVPRMLENLRAVREAGGTVVVATDAGNPLTLHGVSIHDEMEAMRRAGLSPMDILVAATRNGARALGRPDLGTLEPGRVADLLVLAENPSEDVGAWRSLLQVVRAGVVTDRAELSWAGGSAGS